MIINKEKSKIIKKIQKFKKIIPDNFPKTSDEEKKKRLERYIFKWVIK